MKTKFVLKLLFIPLSLIFLPQDLLGQKVKVAYVSQNDFEFALLKSKESKHLHNFRTEYDFTDCTIFNIDVNDYWLNYFRQNLDSTIFDVEEIFMPSYLTEDATFNWNKYTNGFWHADSKLTNWLRQLHRNNQIDIIIINSKPILDSRYSEVYQLNNFPSYGLIQDRNWIYSLNSLYVFNCYGGKIIAQTNLRYNDYIRILKGADLSKKKYEEISETDIDIAMKEIIKINNDLASKVIKKIIAFSKKL